MKIEGACHCRDISYEAVVDPARVSICHCTDCQALTGSAYRVTVPTLIEDFKLRSGSPKIYVKTATAEPSARKHFARAAGHRSTPIRWTTRRRTGCESAASNNGISWFRRCRIWCGSALGWTGRIEDIPKRQRE